MQVPKSCTTCQHLVGGGGQFSKCSATGYYASVTRRFPVTGCDKNFSMWEKRLSVKEKFLFWLKG